MHTLEVGVLESLAKLRQDASYWLTSSGGRVFIVIIISIGLSVENVIWKRWEHVTTTFGLATQM
jgi:hypothetical protein